MMNFLKGILTVCFAVFIFLLLRTDSVKDVDAAVIRTALQSAPGIENLTAGNDHDLKRFFDINAADTRGYVYFRSASIMSVDEVLVIKTENKEEAKTFEDACDRRISVQRTNFEGYGADQIAVLDQAVVKVRGNYLFYAVSPDAADWEKIFTDEVKS